MARSVTFAEARHRRRAEGSRCGGYRAEPDRPPDRHLGVSRSPRAISRGHRPPHARICPVLSQLRSGQRLPRLHERDSAGRHDDRLGPDRLRARSSTARAAGTPRQRRSNAAPRRRPLAISSPSSPPSHSAPVRRRQVLGRHSDNPEVHRVVGGICQADTRHHDLCIGTLDRMRTDTEGSARCRPRCSPSGLGRWGRTEGWLEMDRYIIHQVSQVHTSMMCRRLGIDPAKARSRSRRSAMWARLGSDHPRREAGSLEPGDRVLAAASAPVSTHRPLEILW